LKKHYKSKKYQNLKNYEDIQELILNDKRSLVIDFNDLLTDFPDLAYLLIEEPNHHFDSLNTALKDALKPIDPEFYKNVNKVNVRIKNLPDSQNIPLKDGLRHKYRNQLVSIQGRITQFTPNYPILREVMYLCVHCGYLYLIQQENSLEKEQRPPKTCENPSCRKRGNYTLVEEESEFSDCKIYTLSEGITELDVIFLDDLVDMDVRYGERVIINGILKMTSTKKSGKTPQYNFYLIANYFENLGKTECTRVNEDQITEFIEENYTNFEEIIHSIHPTSELESFLLQKMFPVMSYCSGGAWDKTLNKRLTINSLIVGEVGWFKTSIMEQITKIVGVNNIGKASGQRTTKGGLVPIAVKDNEGKIRVFIGLLAEFDGKVVWIDEGQGLDIDSKNGIADMEHGSIPLVSFGQNLVLPATGSLIMTQNWIGIEYDPEKTFLENIGLPRNVFDRFDLVFEVNAPTPDEAEFIVDNLKTLPKWTDDEIYTYLEMVKEIYCSGKIEFPEDIEDEFKGYWKDIYRLSKDKSLKNESLNIRSLNTIFKVLHWLSASHLRYKITWDDSEYIKDKIIPHIIQFMKTKAVDSVKIHGVDSAFSIIKELLLEQPIVTLDMFVPRYRAYLFKITNNSEYVDRKMSEETTLDKNKPLRTLLKKMEYVQEKHGCVIDRTQKLGTVIYYRHDPETGEGAEIDEKNTIFPKFETGSDRSDRSDFTNMTNMTNMTEKSLREKNEKSDPTPVSTDISKTSLKDFHKEIVDFIGTGALHSLCVTHFNLKGYTKEEIVKSIDFLKNYGVLIERKKGYLECIDKI